MNTKSSLFLTSCIAVLALSACQSTQPANLDARYDRTAQIDAAMQRVSASSGFGGSLASLERKYKRKPEDEKLATAYASSLRRAEYPEQAATVLAPFAKDKKGSAAAKSEYAAIQLALGNFESAEKYAQKAVVSDSKFYTAYHHLGIALDAQNMLKEAERAYRKGLELWEGDPTSIMNNLALNLASQNFLDEAVEILRRAKALSPERREIERNLRIITALQESEGAPAPKPHKKPNSI